MMNEIKLIQGDCLEEMDKLISDGIKVDVIITDPPYGTTACKWDSIIPFDEMWERLNKLIKPNGAIVLFGSEPFSSALRMSNIKNYKYDWVWEKTKAGNFIQAKNMPLKLHELISVFSNGVVIHKGQSKKRMKYYPQGVKNIDKDWYRPKVYNSEHNFKRPSHKTKRKITQENYPSTILKFNSVHNPPHPTQKPITLMEYLIKTYTNEGELVLDFTMGSGSTGVACKNLSRNFIGIEIDEKYFKIAKQNLSTIILKKKAGNSSVA
jgi:site-specific DNA-methyltransferase (adenine-specific)